MKPTLLVLAAGMGSRYGGVKQIDPVGTSGEAIIDYSIYDAIRAGFDRVVFVIRREIEEDVRAFFAGKFEDRLRIDYVYQELTDIPIGFNLPPLREKPWGTAHAVLAARQVMEAPFAVINGDDFYGADALKTMADYLSALPPDSTDYAMVGYRLDVTLSDHGTVSRGIVEHDADRWLQSIEEHTKISRRDGGGDIVSYADDGSVRANFTGTEATSMNLFGFTPPAMRQFWTEFGSFLEETEGQPKAEFYIPLAMNRLKVAGTARMKVLPTDSEWFGVTYREDRPLVVERIRRLVDAGAYPRALWGSSS